MPSTHELKAPRVAHDGPNTETGYPGEGEAQAQRLEDIAPGSQVNRPETVINKQVKGFIVLLLLALVAAGYGFYYLKTHPRLLDGKVPVTTPGASLPGPLEPSTPAPRKGAAQSTVAAPAAPTMQPSSSDTPVTTVAQGETATPSAAATPADIAQNASSMQGLEARLDDWTKQVSALTEVINQLIAGSAQTREQVAQLAERLRPVPPIVATARPPQPRPTVVRAAVPPKPAVSAPLVNGPGGATLVSVDLWNGAPSVAISEGPTLRFLSPGDATAHGLIVKSVDTTAQKVTFATPSGETVVAGIDARNP